MELIKVHVPFTILRGLFQYCVGVKYLNKFPLYAEGNTVHKEKFTKVRMCTESVKEN
jgi:hypothetical protein